MNSLVAVEISEEELDEVSRQVSEEVNKFSPWRHQTTEGQNNIIKVIVARIIQRKIREIFGKPLPMLRMRSPRVLRKS